MNPVRRAVSKPVTERSGASVSAPLSSGELRLPRFVGTLLALALFLRPQR